MACLHRRVRDSACRLQVRPPRCVRRQPRRRLLEITAHRAGDLPCDLPSQYVEPRPLDAVFSWTAWVSRCRKGKTGMDLNEARDVEVLGWQWHQLERTQTICTSLQTDNHTNPSLLNFTGQMLFLTPNEQCQSTEDTLHYVKLH